MRTKSFAVPALGLSLVAISLLSGCGKGRGGEAVFGPSQPPAPEVKVAVAPRTVTLEVGQAAQLVAVVAGVPAGASTGVKWQSSDASVASVSASGTVTCQAAGSVAVSAAAEAAAGASDRAAVSCTAAPPPGPTPTPAPPPPPAPTPTPAPVPPSLVAVDKTALSFQYAMGSPGCPVQVGEFAVVNRSPHRIKVEMRAGHASLELTPDAWELQPGQAAPHPVNVRFNCSATGSFTTSITITASGGGTTETKRIEVRGTIQ